MSLAKNIQFLRKKHGLTQEDLSEYLCVSRQSISKWETGEAYPETEKIIALCDKFDVSMDMLVRGDLTAEVEIENSEDTSNDNANDFSEDSQEAPLTDFEDEEDNPKIKKWERVNNALSVIVMILSIAVFITVGAVTMIWHPTWLSIVCGAFVCAVMEIVFKLLGGKRSYEDLIGNCCSILMSLTALAYVVMNVFIGKWHPSWIMFVIAVFLCAVLGALGKLWEKKSK